MQEETPRQDTSDAAPVEQSPGSQEQVAPPTPAHEEADRAAGRDDVDYSQAGDAEPDDDTAPDADAPGDDVAPEELEEHAQDEPDQPDEVDSNG